MFPVRSPRELLLLALLPLAAALVPPVAAAQSPRIDTACFEPFATSDGYVLTPQCPRQPLATLFDTDRYDLSLLPPIGPGGPRRDQLRIYEARIPGTELVVTPSPLRNQWMYRPGETYGANTSFPTNPRDAASDFVFGVRVPF